MISVKLKRILAMHPMEVLYRMQKEFRTWQQRMDPARTVRLYQASVCPEETMEEILAGLRQRLYAPWDDGVARLRSTFSEDHPQWAHACIAKANDLVNNQFCILDRQLAMNGSVDWHVDPLAGSSVPLKFWHDIDIWNNSDVREVRYPWELNRHQDFMTLAKAYWLTRDESYVRHLLSLWQHWMDHNPVHIGINWVSPLEMALRIISWTWSLYWIRPCPLFEAAIYDRILQFVGMQALFIDGFLSKYSSANNHLIGEALGLLYVGVFFPELRNSSQWLETGVRLIERELIRQTSPEGWSLEQSCGYHRYGLWYGLLAQFALLKIDRTLSDTILDRLQKMAQALIVFCDDRDVVPDIGDQDGGKAIRLSEGVINPNTELFWVSSRLFPLSLRSVASQLESEAAWWLSGGQLNRPKVVPPGKRLVHWPQAGYTIIDVGHDKNNQHLILDAGSLGLGKLAAHGHADALSVWLSVGGQPVLVDSGTFLYLGARKERDFFRATMAHNTMVWEGTSQSKMSGPFQWGSRIQPRVLKTESSPDLIIEAEIKNVAGQPVHQRRMVSFTSKGSWSIRDHVSGTVRGEVFILYHFSPDGNYTFDQTGLLAEFELFSLMIRIESGQNVNVEWNQEHEWGRYSPQFGIKKYAPLLWVRYNGELPLTVETSICLGGSSEVKAL